MAIELIDRATLADELRDISTKGKTVSQAVADSVAVVLAHVTRRVAGELSELRATNAALASVVAQLPDRLGAIESRLLAMEQSK